MMSSPESDGFPPDVIAQLGTYVYRLIDPRNGETFYVGKGKGNRVFAHVQAQVAKDDELDAKLQRIHEIHLAGFEVAHVIHRHGMDDATALEVEAALIDAYPGLSNVMGGSGSSDFGVMHAREVVRKYRAEPAHFRHRALLINVSKTAGERPLYEAVRYAWKIDAERAQDAEVVLAVRDGLIIGAFIAERWLPATAKNFPGHESVEGRYGFVGREAPAELAKQYLHKRIPEKFRKPGAANPIRYTW